MKVIKRASTSERAIGWSWDYKTLETLHDETRSVDGYENSMEAIDSLLTRLEKAGCLVIDAPLPDNAEYPEPLYKAQAHVMQQAFEALNLPCSRWNKQQTLIVNAAITALRDALNARETK